MRRASLGLLLVLAPQVCRAGEVVDPVFWDSEADFLKQVEEGEFADRLELHLLQYAADPRWRSEWAALRYSGNGLFAEYGSTTGTELYSNAQIALNLYPLERLQLRYDRRTYEEGRFDVSDQRFDALWYPTSGFALVFSGMPTFDKEYSSIGYGLRLGAPKSRSALELRIIHDQFVWNLKTAGDVRFTRRPVRLLADGFFEVGPWRVHGSIDWGLEWAATENVPGGARSTEGFQRFADVEVEWAQGGWGAGARLTGAALAKAQSEQAGGAYRLDRSWGRAVVTFRRDLGKWAVSALAGWASQRDALSSPAVPDGAYAAGSLLCGVDGGLRATRGLEVRLGYLGSLQRAERTASNPGPLSNLEEDAYLDKAHVRGVYAFKPGMAIELLLSQALRGGRFGGGSAKALFAF